MMLPHPPAHELDELENASEPQPARDTQPVLAKKSSRRSPPKAKRSSPGLIRQTGAAAEAAGGRVAAVWVPVSKLRPWIDNPKKKSAKWRAKVFAVAESIREFGFGAPILAREQNGELITGHTRLQAAVSILRMKEVPVRYMKLTEHKAHLLAAADNKLGEEQEWDDDKLDKLLAKYDDEEKATAGFEMDLALEKEDRARRKKERNGDVDGLSDEPSFEVKFQVVVTCKNEKEQVKLLERFGDEGLEVRALIG